MTPTRPGLTRELAPWRDILGIPVADLTEAEALSLLENRLDAGHYTPVAFLNANNANIAMDVPEFGRSLDNFVILSDGIGVDIAAWLLHGRMFKANLNGTDFIPALLAHLKNPCRVGLVGARADVVQTASERLGERYPQHEFRVVTDGYFKPEDEAGIRAKLHDWQPHIVLVAMGVPRQEQFTERVLGPDTCNMPITVGALFDLYTGTIPRAPEWMRMSRTEWIYRLWREPKRLWRRYVMGNPLFVLRVVKCRLTGKSRGGGAPLPAPARQER